MMRSRLPQLVLAAFLLLLPACDSNEDGGDGTERAANIEGEWTTGVVSTNAGSETYYAEYTFETDENGVVGSGYLVSDRRDADPQKTEFAIEGNYDYPVLQLTSGADHQLSPLDCTVNSSSRITCESDINETLTLSRVDDSEKVESVEATWSARPPYTNILNIEQSGSILTGTVEFPQRDGSVQTFESEGKYFYPILDFETFMPDSDATAEFNCVLENESVLNCELYATERGVVLGSAIKLDRQ